MSHLTTLQITCAPTAIALSTLHVSTGGTGYLLIPAGGIPAGPNYVGDMVRDGAFIYYCTGAGSPGTWIKWPHYPTS